MSKKELGNYNVSVLRSLIIKAFALDELRVLCQDFGIDYDELKGKNRNAKAGELIQYFKRRNQLSELLQQLKQHRPNVVWKEAEETEYGIDSPVLLSVSYVVIAMLRTDAQELYDLHRNKPEMREVIELLDCGDSDSFSKRYGLQRAEWQPFSDSDSSMREALDIFSNQPIESDKGLFGVKFADYTSMFFNDSEMDTAFNLKSRGCIYFVDAISLLHDGISEWLHLLNIYEPRAIIVISPMNFRQQELNRKLEGYLRGCYSSFFMHYDKRRSPRYGLVTASTSELNRCLEAGLKDLKLSERIPEPWVQWLSEQT
jgi:hypothetical protein